MNWKLLSIACSLLATMALPGVIGSEGIIIWSVTEPTLNPNPVEAGGTGEVSFEVEVWNRRDVTGCRETVVTGMYGFPACAYILQWTISLDGEWLTEGSTPLGTNFAPYVRTLQEERTRTMIEVTEQVHVDATPGEHTLHVQANWIVSVPISRFGSLSPFDHAYPCGVNDHLDHPPYRCTYYQTGWVNAPVTSVQVLPPQEAGVLQINAKPTGWL